MKYLHRTKDGREIPLNELSAEHLGNILSYIEKRARQGVNLNSGSLLWDEVGDYDIETIYDEDVKELMNYKHYKNEWKRRRKLWEKMKKEKTTKKEKKVVRWLKAEYGGIWSWESPTGFLKATIDWVDADDVYLGLLRMNGYVLWTWNVNDGEEDGLKDMIEKKVMSLYAQFKKDTEGVAV